MAKKNGLIAAIDGLPWILKIIFCFFGFDVIWSIYRIVKYANPFDLVMMIISIVMLVGSFTIGWILDLVCVILKGKPFLA